MKMSRTLGRNWLDEGTYVLQRSMDSWSISKVNVTFQGLPTPSISSVEVCHAHCTAPKIVSMNLHPSMSINTTPEKRYRNVCSHPQSGPGGAPLDASRPRSPCLQLGRRGIRWPRSRLPTMRVSGQFRGPPCAEQRGCRMSPLSWIGCDFPRNKLQPHMPPGADPGPCIIQFASS